MKQIFQENRNALLLLLALLFVLLLAVYILFYRPVSTDLESTEMQEQQLKAEVSLLEEEQEELAEDGDMSEQEIVSLQLESQIPLTPELDELLLTLNAIELASNSKIEVMNFGYQGNLPTRELRDEETDNSNTVEAANEENERIEEGIDEETIEEEILFEEFDIPDALQPIIVTLDIVSPDYESFQLLLEGIEKEERMMVVTNLNFNKPAERDLLLAENPDETITTTISVMTFYYDDTLHNNL